MEQIRDGHDLAKMVCKWLGSLGAHLTRLGCPDVEEKPKKRRGEVKLELVEIPEDCMVPTWRWKPRVLHKELKKAKRERERRCTKPRPPATGCSPHRSHNIRGINGASLVFFWTCGSYWCGSGKRILELSAKLLAECRGQRGPRQQKL